MKEKPTLSQWLAWILLALITLSIVAIALVSAADMNITFKPSTIFGHNETGVKACSFYNESLTCDQIRDNCNTEVTQFLVSTNLNLQERIKAAEAALGAAKVDQYILWGSLLVSLFLLGWRIKDIYFIKK